jgi:hypothetical protein
MSVSSVNPATAQTYQSTSDGAYSASGTSVTTSTSATGTASSSVSVDAPQSSTVVTLSPNAQAIASLAARGVSITESSLLNVDISASDPLSVQFTSIAKSVAASHAANSLQTSGVGMSLSGFQNLVAQLGGTQQQADQIFQGFDTNGDGSISNQEFENGIASALNNDSTPFAQSLFKLLDPTGSGSVSSSEFSKFEMAFLHGRTALSSES